MDSSYRFLTLGTPWTQSMRSRDVNAATRLAKLVGGVIKRDTVVRALCDIQSSSLRRFQIQHCPCFYYLSDN